MRHLLLAVAIFAVVSGCGLQLRGSSSAATALAGSRIHVDAPRSIGAAAELRDILGASDVKLARRAKSADYTIRLAGERVTRDVLSVSPQTGKVEEFQLNYVVLLTVLRPDGQKLVEDAYITLQRDFTFDQDAVMGNFSEEEILRDELAREAAEQALRRSAAAIARDTKGATP